MLPTLTVVRLVKEEVILTAEQPGCLVVLTSELQTGHRPAAEITGGVRHSHHTLRHSS